MNVLGTYKNGNYNVTILSDGTRIRTTKDDEFIPDHAENLDIKISNKCSMMCKYCHEGSTPHGKISDVLNEKFVNTLHPYQEIAIGGGNVFDYSDLVPFLKKLKELKVIANITVNQVHFEQNINLIEELVNEQLIYGLGISLDNPTSNFIRKVMRFKNAVIHTINGILTEKDVEKLSGNNLKLLILGYKDLRRGSDYLHRSENRIKENQKYLYDNIVDIQNKFSVVSFDNLAIEQLDIRRILSDEEWDTFYQGDDGTSTFYIDAVERKFAKSSTAPLNERYDLLDNVDDMFNIIRNGGKIVD